MKTLTLRVQDSLDRWLAEEAKRLSQTKSEIVRPALKQRQDGKKPRSLHERMKDVCGSIKGAPRDVSRNMDRYMKGFGE